MKIKTLPGVIPTLSNDAEFFPGHAEVLGADLHDQRRGGADRTPGRRAGLGGSGQPLLLDRPQNGIGGFWATQIFPFADPTSVGGYLDFEKAVYDARGSPLRRTSSAPLCVSSARFGERSGLMPE